MASNDGSGSRKVDTNFNEVPGFRNTQEDAERDLDSISIRPLLTPSPSCGEPQSDPLSAALKQKLMLEAKSPSPELTQDEEVALLEISPTESYSHPLDPLRRLVELQRTPSKEESAKTANAKQNLKGSSEVPYTELEMTQKKAAEQKSSSHHRIKNSLPENTSADHSLRDDIIISKLLDTHYQQFAQGKAIDVLPFITQEKRTKTLDNQKHPPDYCFLNWNWSLIRKASFFTAFSAIVGCLCIVVALLATVPRRCLPPHAWYQGTVFYEIFPASFQDSDRDGIGDLRGIASRVDYLAGLGVRAIRLNSIFPASHYPEGFDKITNFTAIEKTLGDFKDFQYMLNVFNEKNISVILDFPIHPYVKDIGELRISVTRKNIADKITNVVHNHRSHRSMRSSRNEFTGKKRFLKPYIDGGIAGLMKSTSDRLNAISQSAVEEAIEFWFQHGVHGVYLKGLEHYVKDPKFVPELKKWRTIKETFRRDGKDKMLMCDYKILDNSNPKTAAAILSTMDLLDVFLDVANGTIHIKEEVSKYHHSSIFERRTYPWIHWNIGNVGTKRLASKVENNLGAILFQFLLPGTISIFYGDEIGLTEIHDPHLDHNDVKAIHHLAPMKWLPNGTGFTRPDTLPWLPFAKTTRTNNIHEKILLNMTTLREQAPSIYMNSIWKGQEGLSNFAFRYADENIVVLERTYPRRNSYVAVYNAGVDEARNDLSSLYFGGELVEDSRGRSGVYVRFDELKLGSGEACVVKLDK